jgi:CRISPR-associated endoribonuclease Cas6
MRFNITIEATKTVTLPVNYQEYLTAALYAYVNAGDVDYAKFIHDDGYLSESGKKYKPATFSYLRVPGSRRRIHGATMEISPGYIGWVVSSPMDDFLRHFANGLIKSAVIRIGSETLKIAAVEGIAAPEITEEMYFTCLSPIVASIRRPDGTTEYLRPEDQPATFSEAIQKNLTNKYKALYGKDPERTDLSLYFDPEFLKTHHGGTKKITYKNIDIIGVLAPFRISGSPELIRLGWEGGVGGKSACGFGCVGGAVNG